MVEPGAIEVEVVYATAQGQQVRKLVVPAGTSVIGAIEASMLGEDHPELQISADRLGIFSRKVAPEHRVEQGDRIEIYRPLQHDPMEARRQRARSGRSAQG